MEEIFTFFLKELITNWAFPNNSLNSLSSLVQGTHKIPPSDHSHGRPCLNELVDLLPWPGHADGADPGGAEIDVMEEKNHWDASLVLFLMATSWPSYCMRL